LIDAHLHLDRFSDPEAAWERLRSVGVTEAIVPGVEEPFEGLELPGIHSALGLHPLAPAHEGWRERLSAAVAQRRPVAIGEVGLDRHGDIDQGERLAWQLGLAAEHRLPLILHLVGDAGALLAAVRRHPAPVMLHRCGGRPSRFQPWWEAGVYCSVGPKTRGDLRLLAAVPEASLLLESDAEDEDAAPWRTLPALYRDAARARGLTLGSIEALVYANTRRFIGEAS